MNGWIVKWTNGWVDGWIDGWKDGMKWYGIINFYLNKVKIVTN